MTTQENLRAAGQVLSKPKTKLVVKAMDKFKFSESKTAEYYFTLNQFNDKIFFGFQTEKEALENKLKGRKSFNMPILLWASLLDAIDKLLAVIPRNEKCKFLELLFLIPYKTLSSPWSFLTIFNIILKSFFYYIIFSYFNKGPDLPRKKVETKGELTIEVLYDHQFAFVGNSLFHLQVCKFNGYLQYGLCKFFHPKVGGFKPSARFNFMHEDEDPFSGVPFKRMSEEEPPFPGIPTKSNCWMSPKTWSDFIDCVEQTADRLAKKNIKLGMHTEIFCKY